MLQAASLVLTRTFVYFLFLFLCVENPTYLESLRTQETGPGCIVKFLAVCVLLCFIDPRPGEEHQKLLLHFPFIFSFIFSVAILQFQFQVENAASNLSDLKSSFVAEEVSGIDRGSKKFAAMLSLKKSILRSLSSISIASLPLAP